MAEKKRLVDIWIVDLNTVYREVPFAVVTGWLQEGRLLPEDKVRVSGTTAWRLVGQVPAFAPFLPRPEPQRAEDRAEALEPVDLGFSWRNPAEAEDEDVDMIPLIDISLVLLIFFMMTAAVSTGYFSPIKTPSAKHQLAAITKDMYWLGIDSKDNKGKIERGPDGEPLPWYSLGKETQMLHPPSLDLAEVLKALEENLKKTEGEVRLRIRADHGLPIETVSAATLELQGLEAAINSRRVLEKGPGRLTISIAGEVSEPQKK